MRVLLDVALALLLLSVASIVAIGRGRHEGFIGKRNKLLVGVLMFVATSSLYTFTNRWHARPLVALAPLWIDRCVPAVPWTVWVYASYPLVFTLTLLLEKDRRRLDRWLWATVALNAFSNAVFLAWPTTIDRSAILAAPS